MSPARVSIIRVPEPAEEVREIVRSIARDLAEGIPLYRIAVVYRHGDPYAPLVRDALDQAGFPWVSSEGTRLSETRPGRALLDLLALPERGFTREAVLAWLDTSPRIEGEVGTISVAAWNRLSRRAGVLRGAAEWQARLRRHAEEIEVELARPAEDDRATLSSARTRWVRESRLIADFVAELSAALRHPPPGATWTDLVARTIQRRDRFVGATERWSESRRAEAEAVDRAIRALAAGDEVAEPPSFGNFQEALVAALENERVPTGQPGEGVMVEPLVAVMGLAFARVYLLGLSEGAYPPSPAADPFFPDDGADPLQRRARQREEERRDFLAALAALDGADARVILSVPESDGRRAAFPSRWLLEIASRLAGRSLDAGAFANLGEQPWLRIVRSARDGVERALEPADLEDRRLADLIHWRQRGRSAAEHPLARRPDLPLGNALRLARARASNRLTPYDGNLSARSSSRRLIESFARGRPSSASAVETWATCGFRFFLAYVLRVEPTDRPEDRWRIDGRERGQLVHRILDQFFRVMRVNGRPAPGEGYTRADQEELEKIAAQRFAEVERRGAAGYALAWETERRAILSDLRLFLRFDAEERVRSGLLPTYFEQRFGFDRRDSWPELAIAVADGTRDVVFRFQGVVDRVDLDPSGKTARAYDYKTGRADAYAGIQDDPVLAGQHLQLALYRRVIQENLKADVVGASYWFVTSKETFALETVEAGAAADARLDAVLGVVARGLRQGAFPSIPGDPSRESFANCVFCDFDRICPVRRDQVWKRKSEDPIARIHRGLARNSADDG